VPTQPDIYWKRYQINSRTGLIATAFTPPELVTERIYFDYPPEALDWAKAAGKPLPPTDYDSGGTRPGPAIASITSPAGLARVRGVVEVKGSIDSRDVVSYNLAYGAGINPDQWVSIGGSDPKLRGQNITLGRWDTTSLDGLYTLRLSLVMQDNLLQYYPVQVTVDNRPPTVRVLSPRAGDNIGPGDKVIKLAAEATDNVEIAYVEFYRNDQLIDTVKEAPYESEWKIDQGGPQTFYVVAYDAAGNSAQSDPIRVNAQRASSP
jgi:hypothetical protein